MSLGPNFFGKPPPEDGPFTVIANIVTKGQAETDLIRPILAKIQQSANSDKEPDCTTYIVSEAIDDPNTFVVYEEYANAAAFHHHNQQSVFQDLAKNADKAEVAHIRYFKHVK